MKRHRCPKLPPSIRIEFDGEWGWFLTTKDEMCEIHWCPLCGTRLSMPKEKP